MLILKSKYLKHVKFSNLDYVFIYSLELDTVFEYLIPNLDLMVKHNTYDGFEVGLSIMGFPLIKLSKSYQTTFIHIVKANPFNPGHSKQIKWTEIEKKTFPKVKIADKRGWYTNVFKSTAYSFRHGSITFYLKDIHRNYERGVGEHIIIKNLNNDSIELDSAYKFSSGSFLHSIMVENAKKDIGEGEQVSIPGWEIIDSPHSLSQTTLQ